MESLRSEIGMEPEAPCAKEDRFSDAPVEMPDIRQKINRIIGNGAVTMVKSTMVDIENGHYLAMKYLFEMIGLYPAIANAASSEGDSLAKILLRHLGVREEPGVPEEAQTKVTEDTVPPAKQGEIDAVE
jgi:hypothetical protein